MNGTGTLLSMRRSGPCLITPTLPPTPAGLSHQQLKRRHIVAAIIHSENSYVATLQRLVNVRFIILFSLFHFIMLSYPHNKENTPSNNIDGKMGIMGMLGKIFHVFHD